VARLGEVISAASAAEQSASAAEVLAANKTAALGIVTLTVLQTCDMPMK